jgi:putative ABC transport system permease protein
MTPDASAMAGFGGPPDFSLMQVALYGFLFIILVLLLLTLLAVLSLPVFFGALSVMNLGLKGTNTLPDPIGKWSRLAGLVFRSLRRNLLRTALTYIALFVLTGMLTFIYGIITFLGNFTADKEKEQLILITEKFGIPSQMKPGYADQVKKILRDKLPKKYQPADIDKSFMTWSFVGASLEPGKQSPENNFFLFALDPEAVTSGMMAEQGLNKEDLGDDGWALLLAVLETVKQEKRNIVIGEDRLKVMNKRVGDEIKFTSTNYKDLVFDCKIVGAFPSGGRMGNAAAMRYDYLLAMMDDYKKQKGVEHPQAGSCLNLIWVRMPSKESFERLSAIVGEQGAFSNPAVKVETFSAFAATVFEPFKRIFWGMKWIIMPAIVAIMCLVIGITITIGVRERRAEMAVLKVLGFQPRQVQAMVVSESVLIGIFGGMLATWTVYFLPRIMDEVSQTFGVKIALFKALKMSEWILVYGPLLGIAVGLIGAFMPSRSASKVKVSEVFAQVA